MSFPTGAPDIIPTPSPRTRPPEAPTLFPCSGASLAPQCPDAADRYAGCRIRTQLPHHLPHLHPRPGSTSRRLLPSRRRDALRSRRHARPKAASGSRGVCACAPRELIKADTIKAYASVQEVLLGGWFWSKFIVGNFTKQFY